MVKLVRAAKRYELMSKNYVRRIVNTNDRIYSHQMLHKQLLNIKKAK